MMMNHQTWFFSRKPYTSCTGGIGVLLDANQCHFTFCKHIQVGAVGNVYIYKHVNVRIRTRDHGIAHISE